MVYTILAEIYSGEMGVANMNMVETPWVTTMALTRPIFLARGGAAKVAIPITMLEIPIMGTLIASVMP